jgi:predicted alpha/beta hydrolase
VEPGRDVALPTRDGRALAGRLFEPAGPPRGAALVVAAMGVRQDFYGPLAAWLAGQGWLALTFDCRGIGASRREPLAALEIDVIGWAERDCGAALEWLAARAGGAPLAWIGHSLGGQILPFAPGHERLARAITVASGSGYWRGHAPGLRWRAWLLWYLAAPLALGAAGYFPGRRLRMVGDLPRGVMAQWRRWCLHPEYAVGVEGEPARRRYAAVRTPLVSLSFTDDEYISARNTEALHACYTGAPRTDRRISPAEAGVPRIGHFGFFRAATGARLWPRYLLPELPAAGDGAGPATGVSEPAAPRG